jgi:hypothetical protein
MRTVNAELRASPLRFREYEGAREGMGISRKQDYPSENSEMPMICDMKSEVDRQALTFFNDSGVSATVTDRRSKFRNCRSSDR